MINELPLPLKTTYAELLDRAATADFHEAFDEAGAFVSKTIKDRRYWYFQSSSADRRTQKYVGPETPQLLERIKQHRQARDDLRERQTLVSTLVRSGNMPRPPSEMGEVVQALARAGVFRLEAVLVGTAAYQIYAAMLGVRLPASALQTGDVDVAQFASVSDIVEEQSPPILEVLKAVDATFRPVPTLHKQKVTAYVASTKFRVEFLTPHIGKETDKPRVLRALQTNAEQLRFLDYLIESPESAVMLHGAGIHVLVPAPQRYAIHKLIVAQERPTGAAAKRDKDLQQAEGLLELFAVKRRIELQTAWQGAVERGPGWRKRIGESLSIINPKIRDLTLKAVGSTRSFVTGLHLNFDPARARYDASRSAVILQARAGSEDVRCVVSREALEDHFGTLGDDRKILETFEKKRSSIEKLVRSKFLTAPIEESGEILIRSDDFSSQRRS